MKEYQMNHPFRHAESLARFGLLAVGSLARHSAKVAHHGHNNTRPNDGAQETVERLTHVTRELFGVDIGGATKEHPLQGL